MRDPPEAAAHPERQVMRIKMLATTVLFVAGCASTAEMANALRPVDLITHRDQYDGAIVNVYGYMIDAPEAHGLWQAKSDFRNARSDRCVSLSIPDKSDMSGFDEEYVVVRGRFRKDLSDVVMLGACNFMSLDIIGRPVLAPPP